MYSKSRGDKQKKCTVHFFRLKTPENVPYIYARSPPIKGVGMAHMVAVAVQEADEDVEEAEEEARRG